MTNQFFKTLITLLLIMGLVSCRSSKNGVVRDHVSKHFYPMPSFTKKLEKEWVIILPGYSGLKVFKDTAHYFRVAQDLNSAGFDVMIVEYKKASRKGGQRLKLGFAKRVRWATEKAIEWGKTEGHINSNTKGHIAGWSAGGEGVILLMNDTAAIHKHHISSVALFYPSNRDSTQLNSNIPILVQTGELDNVTPQKNISNTYGNKSNVDYIVYPNAHHGFDVKSIVDKKHLRLPPIVGKKLIFQYNKSAADKSREKLIDFFLTR